jgi:hypothetical protein
MKVRFVTLLGIATALPAAEPTTLNLSTDLVRLGIADRNLAPDTPALDAQPLFLAAIQYIQNNPVKVLTADPGSYYFLTSKTPTQYLIFQSVSDLTVDLRGSAVYFKYGLLQGFTVANCQRFTLKNLSIDCLVPRFTQVQLMAVDPAQGTLTYALLPGWADPATFTDSVFGPPELLAFVFRSGSLVPGTSLTFINHPLTSPTLVISPNGPPWQQSGTLSTLQPGDTVLVEDRSGAGAIAVADSDSITLSNIEIHGTGGGFAVQVGQSSNSIVENVRITPRPGALAASNADGIHFTGSLRNNHIRHCYVTRALDDALAMDSEEVASVVSQSGPRQLIVTRQDSIRFPNGTLIDFVPIATGAEVPGATIVSQEPPDSINVGFFDQVNLTFDRDLPPVTPGDFLVYGAANMRGEGSSIEDNLVEDSFGRGMFLGGLENVVIQRNVIRRSPNAGINVGQVTVPNAGAEIPAHGIAIQSNSIENVLGPAATGAGGVYATQAAIIVDSTDQYFDFFTAPVNSDISVLNNYVADSGRAGMWIGELNGGHVTGNVIVRWNEYPNLPVWGDNPIPQDFAQPLVVRNSQDVTTGGNIMDATSTLHGPVGLSPSSAAVNAGESAGSFAVEASIAHFSWRAISDSDWLTVKRSGSRTGDGTVAYEVAANGTSAPRTGSITVAGVVFTVTQAACQTGPCVERRE